MPFLRLSAAASRLPASFLCVGVPVSCLVLPLLCAALSPGSCRPPYFFSLSFGLSLSPCLFSCFASCGDGVILGSVLNLFLPFWVPLTYRGSRRPPSVSAAPSVFLFFCRVCSVCPFLFAVGPLFLFCLGDLIGDVGLASSHGLDRTAANYTGADQLSSLPCRPGRPRAAKSAHMVRSVGFVCIAKITLLLVFNISACCCDLLLTAWTV